MRDASPDRYREELREEQVAADPFAQFYTWFQIAQTTEMIHPDAMALATCNRQGQPSVRMVLLRGFDERGFVFFTNYNSRKSRDLQENPCAALVFYWEDLEKQVRIEGRVERIADDESDAYFASRPRGSQIGAWASPQSQVLADRGELQTYEEQTRERFAAEKSVPRPDFWGGWRVVPDVFEFWQGRDNRLHDRFRFQRDGVKWVRERLAP